MEAAKWLPQHLTMLSNLWGKLQVHEFHSSHNPLNQRALIVYQAEQQQAWHQAIDSPGGAWDIGTLCKSTLSRVCNIVYRKDRQKLDNQRDYHIHPLSLYVSSFSDSFHLFFLPSPSLTSTYLQCPCPHVVCDTNISILPIHVSMYCDTHVSMWSL